MTAEQPAEPGRAVLVAVASEHGATAQIAQAIGKVLAMRGFHTTVLPAEQVQQVGGYDAVVIGSAVYSGHWLAPAKDLVARFREAIAERPVWLFSSGPVGDPSGKPAQMMAQDPVDLVELRATIRARDHRVFAGKLDRGNVGFFQQRAALLVFRVDGDFRDWAEIEAWADDIADQLTPMTREYPPVIPIEGNGAHGPESASTETAV